MYHVHAWCVKVEGIAAGYNASGSVPALRFEDLYILTNAGDLEDLVHLPTSNGIGSKSSLDDVKEGTEFYI